MDDPNTNLSAARRWVERIVIGLNLCPFAEAPMQAGRVRFVESQAHDLEGLLHELVGEIDRLDQGEPDADTTLLVVPTLLRAFDDFLDAIGMAEALIEQMGHKGSYQLAHFHPDYVFADTQPDDPANLTNRSPLPMIHILRWADVREAMNTHPNVAAIPIDNQTRLREMGLTAIVHHLETQ